MSNPDTPTSPTPTRIPPRNISFTSASGEFHQYSIRKDSTYDLFVHATISSNFYLDAGDAWENQDHALQLDKYTFTEQEIANLKEILFSPVIPE